MSKGEIVPLTSEVILAEFVPPESHTPAVRNEIETALASGDLEALALTIQAVQLAITVQQQQATLTRQLIELSATCGGHNTYNIRFGDVRVSNSVRVSHNSWGIADAIALGYAGILIAILLGAGLLGLGERLTPHPPHSLNPQRGSR